MLIVRRLSVGLRFMVGKAPKSSPGTRVGRPLGKVRHSHRSFSSPHYSWSGWDPTRPFNCIPISDLQFSDLGCGNWVRSRMRGYRVSVALIASWSVRRFGSSSGSYTATFTGSASGARAATHIHFHGLSSGARAATRSHLHMLGSGSGTGSGTGRVRSGSQ